MTDAKAIECAEALIQFCKEQEECLNCVFHSKKRWWCYINGYTLQNEYSSSEVNENYAAKKKNHGYI